MLDKDKLRGWINYCVTGRSLYPIVAILLHLRVPFEFVPHRKRVGKKRNYWQCGYLEFDLEEGGDLTIADILFCLDQRFKSTMDFTIISETRW